MRIIKPLVIVEDDLDMVMPNGLTLAAHMMKKTEMFTRKCYKSEGKIGPETYRKFLPAVFGTRRHTGIAEHRMVSVTFITDRGVSHEAVRHRMAAYLQESTRYCDYTGEGDKSHGVTYILPPWVNPEATTYGHKGSAHEWELFKADLLADDERYARWRAAGWRPEESRYWLPQGVKTEYVASLNLGSWFNFFFKRTAPEAHPQIRQLAIPLLNYFKTRMPEFFGTLRAKEAEEDAVLNQDGTFLHKGVIYTQAKLVVNPFYDAVPFETVYECETKQ